MEVGPFRRSTQRWVDGRATCDLGNERPQPWLPTDRHSVMARRPRECGSLPTGTLRQRGDERR